MITGFTAGVGKAAAFALGAMGADLALVCRNADKGRAVSEAVASETGASVRVYVGDLGVLADIRRVASEFAESGQPLHVLFNNAGVVMQSRSETVDGFETTFAINHLGYFLLTNLLLPQLRASEGARVVCTASDAHKFAGRSLDFDDLQCERGYATFTAYGRSKLANILFTRELARRERDAGVTANAFHPGFVGSDFATNNGLFAKVAMTLGRPFARSIERGAETGVYLCSSPDVADVTGEYFYDMKPHGASSAARNDADAQRLWAESERLTGLA